MYIVKPGKSLTGAVKLTEKADLTSILILNMALDLMHVHCFRCQIMMDLVKM